MGRTGRTERTGRTGRTGRMGRTVRTGRNGRTYGTDGADATDETESTDGTDATGRTRINYAETSWKQSGKNDGIRHGGHPTIQWRPAINMALTVTNRFAGNLLEYVLDY